LIRRWYLALLSLLALALLPLQAAAQTVPPVVVKLVGMSPAQVYAGTVCGVYEEVEAGSRWVKIPGLEDQVIDLVQLNNDVLVAIGGGKLYRRGPGEAWQSVGAEIGSPRALAADPTGTRVYLLAGGTSYAVFRSDDTGRSWQMLTSTTAEVAPFDIAVARDITTSQDVIVFDFGLSGRAGGGSVLMRSVDSGATWNEIPTGSDARTRLRLGSIFLDRWESFTFYIVASRPNDPATRLYRFAPTANTLQEVGIPADLQTGGISSLTTYAGTMVIAGPKGPFVGPIQGGAAAFRRYDRGLNGAQVLDLITTSAPRVGTVIFAGTTRGVFVGNPSAVDNWSLNSPGMAACPNQGPSPFDPIAPFPDSAQRRYFLETSHSLSYEFKSFWETNGGLPVFGYPLSEEFVERNADLNQDFTTQYLERERFEFHPDNAAPYRVLLGRLGDELLRLQSRDWRTEGGTNNPFPNTPCQRFDVGGQQRSVCGPFLQYWRTHGLEFDGRRGVSYNESLALFGLPLTAPKVETNHDGNEVVTQWFERARFEYHPNNPDPYKVLLGRLGSEVLRARGVQVP
jgi:hypothetical protein